LIPKGRAKLPLCLDRNVGEQRGVSPGQAKTSLRSFCGSFGVAAATPYHGAPRHPIPKRRANYHCRSAGFGLIVVQIQQRKFMAIGIGLIIAIVVLVVVLGLAGFVVGVYNKLVTMRNRYKNAYAQIDVQLKRRYDLIPNLVEIAKGYIKHERETLENVTKARNIAYAASQAAAANPGDSGAMKNLVSAESGLAGTLSRLMMVSEQYPDLKANQNMMQLTEELTSTENKISFARQAYNDTVMVYNTDREVFPSNLIAGMFNFAAAELFVVDKPEQKDAPKVSF
jgi:LemA protein